MEQARTLPPPLAAACSDGHPVELWVLVNGDVVPCTGLFLPPAEGGRPQMSTTLPETFVGVVRGGAAVRGFFADREGAIHTFLSSVREWAPYKDHPRSARVVVEIPTSVAACQRRRGKRHGTPAYEVQLGVSVRGTSERVKGRLVDASPNGISVRLVRNAQNWFAEGTQLDVTVTLPEHAEPVTFTAVVSRAASEALHFLYGLRVRQDAHGRRMLGEILQTLD